VRKSDQKYSFSAGVDYVEFDLFGSFDEDSENGTRLCFSIRIIDDQAFEKDEYLSLHVFSERNVVIYNPYIEIHIHDDDCELCTKSHDTMLCSYDLFRRLRVLH